MRKRKEKKELISVNEADKRNEKKKRIWRNKGNKKEEEIHKVE